MFAYKPLHMSVASNNMPNGVRNFMPHFAQSDVRIARVFVGFFHRHQRAAYLAHNCQRGALIILHTSASRAPYESTVRVHACVHSLIISIRVRIVLRSAVVTSTPGLCVCLCCVISGSSSTCTDICMRLCGCGHVHINWTTFLRGTHTPN